MPNLFLGIGSFPFVSSTLCLCVCVIVIRCVFVRVCFEYVSFSHRLDISIESWHFCVSACAHPHTTPHSLIIFRESLVSFVELMSMGISFVLKVALKRCHLVPTCCNSENATQKLNVTTHIELDAMPSE